MEENVYNYCLEVHEDGNLYMVTEYINGYITIWAANATIEVAGFPLSLHESTFWKTYSRRPFFGRGPENRFS